MQQRGFSLIECIVFMVVMAIVSTGLLIGINTVINNNSIPAQITSASFLANGRMQIILMNLAVNGYSTATLDPCAGATPATTNICAPYVGATTPTPAITSYQTAYGYTVSSSSSGSNPKTITVTVSGTGNASINASVYNYANN